MEINEKIVKAKQALAFRGRGDSAREVDMNFGDERVPPGPASWSTTGRSWISGTNLKYYLKNGL